MEKMLSFLHTKISNNGSFMWQKVQSVHIYLLKTSKKYFGEVPFKNISCLLTNGS